LLRQITSWIYRPLKSAPFGAALSLLIRIKPSAKISAWDGAASRIIRVSQRDFFGWDSFVLCNGVRAAIVLDCRSGRHAESDLSLPSVCPICGDDHVGKRTVCQSTLRVSENCDLVA